MTSRWRYEQDLSAPALMAQEIALRMHDWGCMKFERFCTAKETISRVNRQPEEWERNIASCAQIGS